MNRSLLSTTSCRLDNINYRTSLPCLASKSHKYSFLSKRFINNSSRIKYNLSHNFFLFSPRFFYNNSKKSLFLTQKSKKFSTQTVPPFATANPYTLSTSSTYTIPNLVNGKWQITKETSPVIDPLSGQTLLYTSKTEELDFQPFINSMKRVPISGKHNIFKNPERFIMLGDVFHTAAHHLNNPIFTDFFIKCIQRTMPKHYQQALGEVKLISDFLKTFSGNSIRFLMKGFTTSGDHIGQQSYGYRWPYGPVAIISPFNFPLEIPALQMLASLMVGNKPLMKPPSSQGLALEQFIRFLHFCGLPNDEIDFINISGKQMNNLLDVLPIKMLQFTGGSDTAEKLIVKTKGRMKAEASGFDWKILAPDVHNFDFVCYQCDQDAYAISGQKCSAQSLLFTHKNWIDAGLFERLELLASKRNLDDYTCSPILSLTNEQIEDHIQKLLKIENAKLLFGGLPLPDNKIPSCYGSFCPTAIHIPIKSLFKKLVSFNNDTSEATGVITEENGKTILNKIIHPLDTNPSAFNKNLHPLVKNKDTKNTENADITNEKYDDIFEYVLDENICKLISVELFAPVQICISYSDACELDMLSTLINSDIFLKHHLTSAIVTENPSFYTHFLSNSCEGVTYVGPQARTSGTPTHSFFGTGQSPYASGIASPEAILQTWTFHREIVFDMLNKDPNTNYTTT